MTRVAAALVAEAYVRARPALRATAWSVALLTASWNTAAPVLHAIGATP